MTVALVTGASRGLGFEVARQLVEHGMTVYAGLRDPAAAPPDGARALRLDVDDPASVAAAAAALDTLDVLVNNAAVYPADMDETPGTADLDAVARVLATDLLGPWRVTQAVLGLLRASPHGRIVNVSSGAGSHGDPEYGLTVAYNPASYGIAKAALNALTARMAQELEGTGVLVNAVCPGLTATTPGAAAAGGRPVSEGAASIVWAARLGDDGPSGGFFRDGRPLPW